jgi:glyoxylase-like metal-dependent hydrolase (beta-lactamase superfamily II)
MSTVSAPTIGRPGDPAAVRQFTLDDVVVTYVVDGVVALRPEKLFADAPADAWAHLGNPAGDLMMSCGGLLVQIRGRTLLIDAGIGVMTSSFALGRVDSGAMLDVLAAQGVTPDDIDVLALTHLHFDHAGWAFTDGAKTFPNARYALAAQEWAAHAGRLDDEAVATSRRVIDEFRSGRGDFELFNDGDEILPGVRALVTAGHTPGHTAYEITSRTGRRLVAFGDAFHSRAQVAHPDWMSTVDADPAGLLTARRRLLTRLSEPQTVAFGGHFGDQPFGRVEVDASGQARWQPIPSVVLAPSPVAHGPGESQADDHHNQHNNIGGSK